MRRMTVIVGLVVAVALAACGGDDSKPSTTGERSSSTSVSASSTPSTPSTSALCPPLGTRSPSEPTDEPQYLTAVTVQSDTCTEAITFTFRSGLPRFHIGYTTGTVTNSAGQAVQPPGAALLKMRFEPAWIADLNQPGAPLTYAGPRVVTPTGTTIIRQVAMYDASEAVVGWVAGLDRRRRFTVTTAPNQVSVVVARR